MRKQRRQHAASRSGRDEKTLKPKPNTLRALGMALAVGSVRASAGRSGLAGMAAGLVFNTLLRRTPTGAAAFGTAMVLNQLYKAGRNARARRAARNPAPPAGTAPPAAP